MEQLFPAFANNDQSPVSARGASSESSHTEVTIVEPRSVATASALSLRGAVVELRPMTEGEARLPKLRSARRAHNDAFERAYLLAALEATNQNVTRAAKLAGVSRQQIQRLMIKHGVRRGDPVSATAADAASGTSG